ncbi:uncharacterized protein [Procambarus clarkii]|uniref:uncharacterized protein isoform X3 n=1 Tax=Procambarus clarkii TaxID=6728 RepID=UPI0037431A57
MQTKNINVVQPAVNKSEKNAVAAATMNSANQSCQTVNSLTHNGSLLNGTGVTANGRPAGSLSTKSGGVSTLVVSQPSVALTSSHYLPMTSPYQPLPVTSSHQQQITSPYQPLPVTSTNQQPVTSVYQPICVTSQHQHPLTSPYQHLPATSSNQQLIKSPYQPLPVTSSHDATHSTMSPYQPPPLPPRAGSQRPDTHAAVHPPPTGCNVHSVYKPVPPPKPFSGAPATVAAGSSSSSSSSSSASAAEDQQHGVATLKEQLAAITGSTLKSSGPPPLLPHILVTDQGHFHTHSTKFPIEIKESSTSLPGPIPPILSAGSTNLPSGQATLSSLLADLAAGSTFFPRSATLGREVKGASVAEGTRSARGSTLPRSRPPTFLDHRPPPVPTRPRPHSTVGVGAGEERDQLLPEDSYLHYLDGIDNPALVHDAHMPSYRAPGGGVQGAHQGIPGSVQGAHQGIPGNVQGAHQGIPPEGTLAGVLPPPYDSPFLSRSTYRPPSLQQQHQAASQQLPPPSHLHPATSQHHPVTSQHHTATSQHHTATSQHHTATSQHHTPTSQHHTATSQHHPATSQHHPATSQHHPATSQHHPATSQHHPATSQQSAFTRETWMRGSQGQFAGIVEILPPQGHLHLNGHVSQHHPPPAAHIPNGGTHNHTNNHLEGAHTHATGHHTHPSSHLTHPATHHSHMNGHQEPVNSVGTQNNRSAGTVDDNQANDAQERGEDQHKDDKWGSLKRGLAARKYQNLKEKISSKFSRGDKHEEQATTPQGTSSQGTNTKSTATHGNTNNATGNSQQETGGIQPGETRDSGRVNKLNTSFRKAIHQSTQKTNLQEATMETSLSTNQEPGGPPQQGSGLPPHYPRGSLHYHTHHASPNQRAAAPLPMSSPQLGRQHQHDPLAHGLANRRSGSYHHLAQLRQEPPTWRSHHYSVDNLVDAHALPSDHTYSGPAVSSGRGQPAGGEGVGSGGSDSGRGTAGSGGEGRLPNNLDTSLDSAASQRQNNQSHSSAGNDSEWVDMTDAELQRIMKKSCGGKSNGGPAARRESLAATPPLPPLSPEATPQPSPQPSPPRHRKYSLSYSSSSSGLNKPDLLEAAGRDGSKTRGVVDGRPPATSQETSAQPTSRRTAASHTQHTHASNKITGGGGSTGHRSLGALAGGWSHRKEEERHKNNAFEPLNKNRVNLGPGGGDLDTGEITSTTEALDLDSMLDGVTEATTDDDTTTCAYDPDVHLIRKQLEGLEGMYSEVLKLLGGGRRGGRHLLANGSGMADLKTSRRRLHGSLSSLPSSIVSSRPGRDKRSRVIDDRVRKTARDTGGKSIHKRFQRLESHVVTLARSVAHLSSEMRTQHLMFQEIESIRGELATIRAGGGGGGGTCGVNAGRAGALVSWESFRAGIPGLSNPGRVKKLIKFFGDEPPLVRIFLRKLGYEKYAGVFEQEKIGMLELPYLTEERLQKIGIPMGPRLRILQEAQGPIRKEGNLSVYVV